MEEQLYKSVRTNRAVEANLSKLTEKEVFIIMLLLREITYKKTAVS